MAKTVLFAYLNSGPNSSPELFFNIEEMRCLPSDTRIQVGSVEFKIFRTEYEPLRDILFFYLQATESVPLNEQQRLLEQAWNEGWADRTDMPF